MKPLTLEERLQVYERIKKILNRKFFVHLLGCGFGFCTYTEIAMGGVVPESWKYTIRDFPELVRYEPHNYGGHWWPTNLRGWFIRRRVIKQVIKDCKNIKS